MSMEHEPLPLRTTSASSSTVPSYHLRPEDIPLLSRPPTSMTSNTSISSSSAYQHNYSQRSHDGPTTTGMGAFSSPPPLLAPISREDAASFGLQQTKANLLFLEKERRKAPTKRMELRYRVMSTTSTLRVAPDDAEWVALERKKKLADSLAPTPAIIGMQLTEDLQHISESDRYRRLNAHRVAFEKYVALQDPTSQALLRRVLQCYEEIELHQFQKHVEEITKKLTAAEAVARDALAERNALRLHVDALRLDLTNMDRKLQAKTEMLSEIAAVHKINLANVNWMNGGTTSGAGNGGGKNGTATTPSRTMAEIRAVQRQVQARHGDAAKQAERQETAQAMRRREDAERLAEEIGRVTQELDNCSLSALDGVAAAEVQGNEDLSEAVESATESNAALYVAAQDTMKNGVNLELEVTPRENL